MGNYKNFRRFTEKAPASWSANKIIKEARKKGIKIRRQTALQIISPHIERTTRLEWTAIKKTSPQYNIHETQSKDYGMTRKQADYLFDLLKWDHHNAHYINLKVNVYRVKNGRYYVLHNWSYTFWREF